MKKEVKTQEIWNDKKKDDIKKLIAAHSKRQSEERKLRTKLLAIQYELEDYIREENETLPRLTILDFIKKYLEALNITKKELATYFEIKDSNLHKYLTGERKLTAEIALKLSAFSHTKPELWINLQVKNEFAELKKDKAKLKRYIRKYDYRNLITE